MASRDEANRYYRIVYFNRAGRFVGLDIKPQGEVDVAELIERNPYPEMEIYRCNARGNNYDGRRVYPPRGLR